MSLSVACYISCAIPFTIDQLVGASGEELSFSIYWIIWAWLQAFPFCTYLAIYIPREFQLQKFAWFLITSLSFIILYLMNQCCSHVLMTKPQLSSPIKLLVQVLNYARKHKFPERRSAFTYWEDECPSRIDLGKEKYGGPFTVEEVEDVKTVLRLIPLIFFITPILTFEKRLYHLPFNIHFCKTTTAKFYLTILESIIVITWLPIYQFLIYPFLYNRIPSMLKRIGLGMFMLVVSNLLNLYT